MTVIDNIPERKLSLYIILGILILSNIAFFQLQRNHQINQTRIVPDIHNEIELENGTEIWSEKVLSTGASIQPVLLLLNGMNRAFSALQAKTETVQIALEYVLMVIGALGMFMLVKNLFPQKKIMSIFVPLLYLSNIFTFTKIIQFPLSWYHGLLPIWLWFILKIAASKGFHAKKFTLGFLLTTPLLSIISTHPGLLIGTITILIGWSIILIRLKKTTIQAFIEQFLIFLPLFLVINSWWLYNYLIVIMENAKPFFQFSISEFNKPAIYETLHNVFPFELQGVPKMAMELYLYAGYTLFFIIYSIIFIGLIIIPVLIKSIVEKKYYLEAYLIISFFLVLGYYLNKDIPDLNLLNNPIGNVWLAPHNVLTLLGTIWPILILLAGIGMSTLYDHIQYKPKRFLTPNLFLVVSFLIALLPLYPTVINSIIHDETQDWNFEFPNYWKEAINWLNAKNKGNDTILFLPNTNPYFFKTTWDYQGANPLGPLLKSRGIYGSELTTNNNLLAYFSKKIYGDINENNYLPVSILKKLNIQYVVFAEDVESDILLNEEYKKFLDNNPSIEKRKEFGEKIRVYEIKDSQNQPKIIATRSLNLFSGTPEQLYELTVSKNALNNTDENRVIVTNDIFQKFNQIKPTVDDAIFGINLKANIAKLNNNYDDFYKYIRGIVEIPEDGQYTIYNEQSDMIYNTSIENDSVQLTFINRNSIVLDKEKIIQPPSVRIQQPLPKEENITMADVELDKSFFIVNENSSREDGFLLTENDLEQKYPLINSGFVVPFSQNNNRIRIYINKKEAIPDEMKQTLSFETDVWQENVSDCNNFDKRDLNEVGIKASKNNDRIDGKYSLQLEADDHTACVSYHRDNINPTSLYQISFWYKPLKGNNNPQMRIIQRTNHGELDDIINLSATKDTWHYFEHILQPQLDLQNFDVVFQTPGGKSEADETDTHLFDQLEISEILALEETEFEINTNKETIDLEQGKHVIELKKGEQEPEINITSMDNSFEQNAWEETLADCNRFEEKTFNELGIKAQQSKDASSGTFSLSLQAKYHIACVAKKLPNVQPGDILKITFDYKNVTGQLDARFKINTAQIDKPLPNNADWTHFENITFIPKGLQNTIISFLVTGDGGQTNEVLFDNIRIKKINNLQDDHILFIKRRVQKTEEQSALDEKNFDIKKIHPWKYRIDVTNDARPFFIILDEPISKNWIAYTPWNSAENSSFVKKMWYKTKKSNIPSEQQFVIDGYKNGWYIDKPGNYTLFIEYKPQSVIRSLYILSLSTEIILATLLIVFIFKNREHKNP